MADRVSEQVRSRIMRTIRSKDTSPELAVRKYLHATGLRYRLHRHDLPGRPDLILPRYLTAVQVYGCFWHQHPDPRCRDARIPDSNFAYWVPKLRGTVRRDRRNRHDLEKLGWHVEVVWACEITTGRLAALAHSIRTRGS